MSPVAPLPAAASIPWSVCDFCNASIEYELRDLMLAVYLRVLLDTD